MKTTVNVSEFRDAFNSFGRTNFSYEALGELFDYLEQWEEDTGEELELDVVGFCCDFSEDTWEQIADQYDIDLDGLDDEEEKQQAVADYLTNEGVYIAQIADCFLYRQH